MRLLLPLLLTAALLVGCSNEPADEVLLDNEIRFDNVVDGRAELIEAEARWAANAPDRYVWRVFTNMPEPAIEATFEGGVATDTVVADHAWDSLPRTPEAAFEIVDRLITEVEDDPDREGNWEDCTGLFFSFDLHPDYGVPLDWGDSDPCADVIGVYFEFEALG